jgi:hypothetical protein
MQFAKDLTGKRFGKLTVIERSEDFVRDGKTHAARWRVLCDCGETRFKTTSELQAGRSRSCGCFARQLRSDRLRMPDGVAARNHILTSYKHAAKKRNLEWGITDGEFFGLIEKQCYYCGRQPSGIARIQQRSSLHVREASELLYTGVDRFDNNRGYVVGNVVPCCKRCNIGKNTLSGFEFIELARAIAKNHSQETFDEAAKAERPVPVLQG